MLEYTLGVVLRIIINVKGNFMDTRFYTQFYSQLDRNREHLISCLLKNGRCKTREDAEEFILENAE